MMREEREMLLIEHNYTDNDINWNYTLSAVFVGAVCEMIKPYQVFHAPEGPSHVIAIYSFQPSKLITMSTILWQLLPSK